jgi:hypothetical protein
LFLVCPGSPSPSKRSWQELQKNAKIRCDVKMQRDGVKMKQYGFLCTFWGLTLSQICCWCLPETVSKTWCDGVKDVDTSRNTYICIAIEILLRYNCAEHEARAEPNASLSRTIERVSLLLYPVNGFKSKIFVQEYKRSPIPLDELHCNEI